MSVPAARGIGALAMLAALCAGGCTPPPQPYWGPTQTLDRVVAEINANNQRIPSLWAVQDFSATIYDDQGHMHNASGSGPLLYLRPGQLLVRGSEVGQSIFEMGCDTDEYWMTLWPGQATQWWGRCRNIGKPCVRPMPLRPDLIVDVLGVADVSDDFTRLPAPTMRFDNERDVYVIDFNAKLTDRWIVQKEVWYDRQTKLAKAVRFYDENGRLVLRAELSNHEAVGGAGGPMMAMRYDLFFPESKSTWTMQLSQVRLQKNGIPRPGSIRRKAGPELKVEQLDEDCGD